MYFCSSPVTGKENKARTHVEKVTFTTALLEGLFRVYEPVETAPVESLADVLFEFKFPLSELVLPTKVFELLDEFSKKSGERLQQTLFFAAKVLMSDDRFSQERRDRLIPIISQLMGL